jgi:hypothetical protein
MERQEDLRQCCGAQVEVDPNHHNSDDRKGNTKKKRKKKKKKSLRDDQ